jgi:hypothetical protein
MREISRRSLLDQVLDKLHQSPPEDLVPSVREELRKVMEERRPVIVQREVWALPKRPDISYSSMIHREKSFQSIDKGKEKEDVEMADVVIESEEVEITRPSSEGEEEDEEEEEDDEIALVEEGIFFSSSSEAEEAPVETVLQDAEDSESESESSDEEARFVGMLRAPREVDLSDGEMEEDELVSPSHSLPTLSLSQVSIEPHSS